VGGDPEDLRAAARRHLENNLTTMLEGMTNLGGAGCGRSPWR
jgi:hypothetical protein